MDFSRMRPPKGRAFLCANDAAVLLAVSTTGRAVGQATPGSPTHKRSLAILTEGGLIELVPGDGYQCTAKGREVVELMLAC